MDRHERWREHDGVSAIDESRTHLNRTLHYVGQERDKAAADGPSSLPAPPGPHEALKRFYESGVEHPAKQAEAPYVQIVISASPSYFRPDDPGAAGTWDEARMAAWRNRVMSWLKAQFSDDLVHVSLHLDEDTPHIHTLVAPTYDRKARKPNQKRRDETDAEFKARKEAAKNRERVRTVSRSSHPLLSQRGSYTSLRQSLAMVLDDLGIGYGNDRDPGAPKGTSTREWVRQQAAELRREQEEFAREQVKIEKNKEAEKAELIQVKNSLIEREAKVSKMEEMVFNLHERMTRILEDVADNLGAGQSLRELSSAVEAYKNRSKPATGILERVLREANVKKSEQQDPEPINTNNDLGPSP